MIRLLIGLALLPTSALTLWSSARARGAVAARASSAAPFTAGFALPPLLWVLRSCGAFGEGEFSRRGAALSRLAYVFGHELTHAAAAWGFGARVTGLKVAEDGGHVDLSRTNAVIALAPYCAPVYTMLVVLGYRLLLWLKPGAGGRAVFLALMGATLSFHLLKTSESIWNARQPDLAAAGGLVFSLAWIVLCNGLVLLLLLKGLFPAAVPLSGCLREAASGSLAFWAWAWAAAGALWTLRRPARQ